MKKIFIIAISIFLSFDIVLASDTIEEELSQDEITEKLENNLEKTEEIENLEIDDEEKEILEEVFDTEDEVDEIKEIIATEPKIESSRSSIPSEFILTDWNYKIDNDTIILESPKYVGVVDFYIPGLYEKDGVTYKIAFESLFALRQVSNIVIEEINGQKVTVKNPDYTLAFYKNESARYLDLRGLDVSNFTSFKEMFFLSTKITYLDISNWDTSNVTDMSHMFNGLQSLQTLKMDGIDTSNVVNMEGMFAYVGLNTIDLSNLNTSNVTNMTRMFHAISAPSLDVSHLDMSNVQVADSMFAGLKNITSLDLSTWNTQNLKNTSSMFSGSKKITSINFDGWDTKNLENIGSMFAQTEGITSLDLTSFNVSKVKNANRTFYGMKNLETLDVSNWNVKNVEYLDNAFAETPKLKELDLSEWKISKVQTFRSTFEGTGVKELDLSNFKTTGMWQAPNLFKNAVNLEKVNLNGWDITSLGMTSSMFENASSLKELDLSTWDFKNIALMNNMFKGTDNLKMINFGDSDFSSVTSATDLFKVDSPTELLVVSSDSFYETYDFVSDNRVARAPWTGLKLSAEAGKFSDNTSEKFLTNKINDYVIKSDKITKDDLDAFIIETPTPTNSSLSFLGWSPDIENLTYPIDVLSTDLVLKAQYGLYHTVTFDLNGVETTAQVLDGDTIDLSLVPDVLEQEGFNYKGWFLEGESEVYDFATPVNSNIKLVAKFDPIQFLITLDVDGVISTVTVDYNSTIDPSTLPLVSDRADAKFMGWRKQGDLELFDFSTAIKETMTLEAVFETNIYTITLNIDGTIQTISVEHNQLIDQAILPTIPNKDGYSIIGWVLEGSSEVFDFTTPITSDLSLFATYKKEDIKKPVVPVKPTPPTGISNPILGYSLMISLFAVTLLVLKKRKIKS